MQGLLESVIHHAPHPKCLTRNRFLPDDHIFQDIWLQLLLFTLAYAQAVQYWAEKVNLPMLDTCCPLAMSVMELKWQVEDHAAFSKHDVLCGLEDTIHEAKSQNTKALPEDVVTPPATANIEGVEPQLMTTQGTDSTILAEPSTCSHRSSPQNEVTVPVTEMDNGTSKYLINPWAASLAMAENQIIPTTGLGDKLVSPTPSDQVGGEGSCILTVTTSIGRLNLEATEVTPSDTIVASVRRMTVGNPHMVASLPGLSKEEMEGSHQSTTMDNLAERDLAED